MASIKDIWESFESACQRGSLPLGESAIEPLVRKVCFALERRHDFRLTPTVLPKAGLPPQMSDAVSFAADIRAVIGVGDFDPLYQLPSILTDRLQIVVFGLEDKNIAGASAIIDGISFVFASSAPEVHALYTCARQLGHLLLLPARAAKGVVAQVEMAHENLHAPLGPYKRFADYFALELLIPSRALGVALKEVRALLEVKNPSLGDIEILYLSRIFGVSFLAMARRCERSGLLPKGGAVAFFEFMNEKHGGPEARARTLELPERPKIEVPPLPTSMATATISLLRTGDVSMEGVAMQLGWSEGYLRRLLS